LEVTDRVMALMRDLLQFSGDPPRRINNIGATFDFGQGVSPERITIGQLPTRSVQPPLDAYSAPEVSTQLQVTLNGGDPEAVTELIAEIEAAVDRVQLGQKP